MELNVAVRLRIMPENVDVNLDEIKEKLTGIVEKYGKIHSTEINPIAFGLNSLDIAILLNDSKGGMEEIETEIRNLPGVGEVNVIDVNRL